MNKGASLAVGLGLVTLLGTAAVVMKGQQQAVVNEVPAEEAGLRAADTANAAIMNQASSAFSSVHGKPAEDAKELLGGGMMDRIPEESFSKSSNLVSAYDGSGGWVYANGVFAPNSPQTLSMPTPAPK